jgi:hypothetical protein
MHPFQVTGCCGLNRGVLHPHSRIRNLARGELQQGWQKPQVTSLCALPEHYDECKVDLWAVHAQSGVFVA